VTGNIQDFILDSETMQAILWQYDGAERLQTLIKKKAEWYDINWKGFWEDWFWNVFNLDTANVCRRSAPSYCNKMACMVSESKIKS